MIACSAVGGFALAYTLCDFASWPRVVYAPVEHSWRLTEAPRPLESGYLGLVLWGLGGALVLAAVVALATRMVGRELSHTWNQLVAAWTLTAFAYAGLYFTWGLWPF